MTPAILDWMIEFWFWKISFGHKTQDIRTSTLGLGLGENSWAKRRACGFGISAPDTNISNMALGPGISSSQTVQIPEETHVY